MDAFQVHPNGETAWLNQNHGIRTNEEFCKEKVLLQEGNSLTNLAATFFREIAFVIKFLVNDQILGFWSVSKKYTHLETDKSDQALVVFLHGLNAAPSFWDNFISRFEKVMGKNPESGIHLFDPKIPHKGHCTLEDPELAKIYDQIVNWATNHPGKPILIYGHSNGTRIALKVETLLRKKAPTNPVHLTLNAGVLYGTSFIQDLTKKIAPKALEKLSLGLITPVACQQLALENTTCQHLLEEAREPLAEGVAERSYEKYAALNDDLVKETGSSLPILVPTKQTNKKEKDYIVIGHGHNSLVDAQAKNQVEHGYSWIKEKLEPAENN